MSTAVGEQEERATTHIQLSTKEKAPKKGADEASSAANEQYNVDQNGWALIESYIWDIGEDEEIEKLIDKALRILLVHPKFNTFLWKNKANLKKIYNDGTFGEVASDIPHIIKEISKEVTVIQLEHTSTFSKFKSMDGFKSMFKHVSMKSGSVSVDSDDTDAVSPDIGDASNSAIALKGAGNAATEGTDNVNKYAFWNFSVYNQLSKMFVLDTKEKEAYLWSFLLSVACCIKYLEIEINAMPQFDVKKSGNSHHEKQRAIWKGFIVPPTHGTVAVNYHPDDDETKLQSTNTEFVPINIEKRRTLAHDSQSALKETQCHGCFVIMEKTNWYKDGKPYCSECIKFRVYQECVRKFVLEYDNEETRDDLWPWYENSKNFNDEDQKSYKELLDLYSDQVLSIGTILDSNLKYYIPRSETLDAAKLNRGPSRGGVSEDDIAEHDRSQIQNLLVKSKTHYQPYRNIRYLRKFAAMFLLNEREIWKDLLKLKKYLKSKRRRPINRKPSGLSPDRSMEADKSMIDDEADFRVTGTDRKTLDELLATEEIQNLLYGTHGLDRVEQQVQIGGDDEEQEEKTAVEDNTHYRRYKGGIDQFLKVWSRLPHWWEPLHDRILLELALMHKVDVNAYYNELDDDEYYQEELEDHYYRAFEFWCTKQVNVEHRLRFLTFVIDQREYPSSMVFMNDIMRNSHLNSFARHKKENEENRRLSKYARDRNKNDDDDDEVYQIQKQPSKLLDVDYDAVNDEKPVRDIEREFRDIVQLLEPEALGIRIWRFIMNQMAAKQRKSLWRALTILAQELPCNNVLSLLEEDRELLRRGSPKYVNAVCQAVIKGSNYPHAVSLYLARYMDENAREDLAREQIWQKFSEEYEQIAIDLVDQIESDHLLALLLVIPTDIQQKTVMQMAVLYRRMRFVNSARVQGVMTHMWSESEFLNPNKAIRTTYLRASEFWKLLWKSPVRFYYCPMGMYATTALLYIGYLSLVTWVSYTWVYPYSTLHWFSMESLMWVCNAGYILYELLELETKRAGYFAMDSMINVFDTIISVNWIWLFLMRILAPVLTENYYGQETLDPRINRNSTDLATIALIKDTSLEIRSDPELRNRRYTIVYMGFWSLQIVVLWIRAIGLLQRTEFMGPLLRMMVNVAKDIASFTVLVIALLIGFLFAVHYIVGGDIDRDVTCDVLTEEEQALLDNSCDDYEVAEYINSMRGISVYLIQTLLGQQDWEVTDENELYGFERGRAQLLTMVVLCFVALGTILSLNMLIAIMTNSFEMLNDKANQQLAFLRVETTYDLAHRGRTMPPPYNIFVIIVWLLITFINILIKGLSCGRCKLNLDNLNPLYITCLRRGTQHGQSSMIRKENQKSKSDYSASKTKKEIESEIQRIATSKFEVDSDDSGSPKPHHRQTSSSSLSLDQLFEKIDSLTDDTKKRYCKHCYCRMKDIKDGRVEDYFAFFEHANQELQFGDIQTSTTSFGLDKDDMRMIQRLMRYCSLCPQCFRPYAISKKSAFEDENQVQSTLASMDALGDLVTDRFDRHHVLMDVISCYFFLLLVWIPLLILTFVPALFSHLAKNIERSEKQNYASHGGDIGAFGDYHHSVQQQVVKNIVDKQYGGSQAFDDDSDQDDEAMNNAFGSQQNVEHALMALMEKLEEIAGGDGVGGKTNKHKMLSNLISDASGNKKKLTTFQLQQKQLKKNEMEAAKLHEADEDSRGDDEKEKDVMLDRGDTENMLMTFDATALKKSIRSEKTAQQMAQQVMEEEEDANTEPENESERKQYLQKQVTFKEDQHDENEAP